MKLYHQDYSTYLQNKLIRQNAFIKKCNNSKCKVINVSNKSFVDYLNEKRSENYDEYLLEKKPIINPINTNAFSWGKILDMNNQNGNGKIRITTQNLSDGIKLDLLLNNISYVGHVFNNTVEIEIPYKDLLNLINNEFYHVIAYVKEFITILKPVKSALFKIINNFPNFENSEDIIITSTIRLLNIPFSSVENIDNKNELIQKLKTEISISLDLKNKDINIAEIRKSLNVKKSIVIKFIVKGNNDMVNKIENMYRDANSFFRNGIGSTSDVKYLLITIKSNKKEN